MLQTSIFDITAGKHQGNPQSVAANARVDKLKDRDRVLALLKVSPFTSKEVAYCMRRQLNAVSGRFTELKAMEKIERTGEIREGCAVWRLK